VLAPCCHALYEICYLQRSNGDRGIGRVVLILLSTGHSNIVYTEILQRLTDDHLGSVYYLHTLEQLLTIWNETMNKVRTGGGPLCSFERIVPAIVSNWNCSKGGPDVLSPLINT
jgi:hypothetical protein